LRDNGLEEDELVSREGEFICRVCATTAVGVSIALLNVLVTIIIATTNRSAVAIGFLTGISEDYSSNLILSIDV